MFNSMSTKFRWGILGLGNIANQFCDGLTSLLDHEIYAVASRSAEKSQTFGDKYKATNRYDSYNSLVADANVDAIYIATPHTLHKDHALLCINAGKPVLCEKPFTVNAQQAQTVVDAAQAKGVFLMEAMWTRFFPLMGEVRSLVASGAIGEPRLVQADFGFRAGVNPEGRLFNPQLGGGALLDVGVYVISFASMILGNATRIASLADIGSTAVDEQNGIVLGYDGGKMALLTSAVRTNTTQRASIYGTDGKIEIDAPFWKPTSMTVSATVKDERREFAKVGNGYNYQAAEVAKCVRAGKLESDVIPHAESIAILKTMDSIRAQWGLVYPVD